MLQSGRIAVTGKADFTANGSGTLEQPTLNAAIHLHDLTFDQDRAGEFTINAVSQGAELRITGQSQFEQADVKVDGNIHLREDWPADVYFRFHQFELDPIFRTYMHGAVNGHSRADGEVHMVGPLRRPRELQFTANLDNLDADVEDVKIKNQGPIRFSVANQTWQIDQFHLVGQDTDISANGKVHLTGDRELDLRAQGRVNLKLIESLNPDFTSSGVVSVDVSVAGPFAKPLMQGRVQVAGGAVAYIDLPSALSDINGSLVFNQDRLQIESLTAHTGGGLVTFGGYATAYNGKFNFDLSVHGQDVRLRYPPGVSAMANADLHFVGSSCRIDVERGNYRHQAGHDAGLRFRRVSGPLAELCGDADQPASEPHSARCSYCHHARIADADGQCAALRRRRFASSGHRREARHPGARGRDRGRSAIQRDQISSGARRYYFHQPRHHNARA